MHVPNKLILKAYLACCNEGTKKSLENTLILQNKTEAKSNISYHNTTSAETKDSFLHHLIPFPCPTFRIYKSHASILQGTVLGKGKIFGTLSL